MDRPPDEQEPERLRGREGQGRRPGVESTRVHPQRHDVDAIRGDAGVDVAVADEAAVRPDLVDLAAHRADPVPGHAAELPRLDDHPVPRRRRSERRRPLMRHVRRDRTSRRAMEALLQRRPRRDQRQVMAPRDQPQAKLAVDLRERMQAELRPFPDDPGARPPPGSPRRPRASSSQAVPTSSAERPSRAAACSRVRYASSGMSRVRRRLIAIAPTATVGSGGRPPPYDRARYADRGSD